MKRWLYGATFFTGTALAAALAITAIYIPAGVAQASQFEGKVRAVTDDELVRYVQRKFHFVNLVSTPQSMPVLGYLFVDTRTGKKIRVKDGDTLGVRFADGSTMKIVFMGLSDDGLHFQAIANSLRGPGVLYTNPRGGPRGAPIGAPIIGSTPISPYYQTPGGDESDSCLSGNVAVCPYTRGG